MKKLVFYQDLKTKSKQLGLTLKKHKNNSSMILSDDNGNVVGRTNSYQTMMQILQSIEDERNEKT